MRTARVRGLWDSIASFEGLHAAWLAARRHKRYAPSSTDFSWNAESLLLALRDQLREGSYLPGEYRLFAVREPKPRIIAAAPFRDRIVHHAVVSAIEPRFEASFVFDSYATRAGKGTHAALLRFHEFFKGYRYVLKCDIAKFFPSIDHLVLKDLLRRKIACAPTLALADLIIDHSPESPDRWPTETPDGPACLALHRRASIPIGNLTSQFFANVYLDPLDHFVKEELRVKGYLRYMDDFCLFGDDKTGLWEHLDHIQSFLAKARLALRRPKTRLYSTSEGVEFLGYRIFRTHRRVVTATARRMEKRLAARYTAVAARRAPPDFFRPSLMSCLGHLRWANGKGLVARMGDRGGWGTARGRETERVEGQSPVNNPMFDDCLRIPHF